MRPVEIVVSGSLLAALPGLEQAAAEIRHETAQAVRDAAYANAHVITGAMRESVYVTDERGSTYSEAVGEATSKNPKFDALPEIPAEPGATLIAVAAPYGIIEEYIRGHPWFTPAVEAQRPKFEQAIGDLGGRVRE